ncbi:Histidine kinase domain-containing protein [Bordetella sputigena]|uniref:sensor histidine kinase n=1 Tax=Bordetella sputigena TaxID=1416810 RepID=UPI0039F04472
MSKRWVAAILLCCCAVSGWAAGAASPAVADGAATAASAAANGTPAASMEAAGNDPVLRLDRAWFQAGDSAAPPAAGGIELALPDNWRRTHPGLDGYAWYVAPFRLAAPPVRPLILYVPHVSLAAEFWLNGSLLNPGVRFDTPRAMGSAMSDAPVRLVLPSGLFRAGENILAVRLQGSTHIRSGISAITIAPPGYVDGSWRLRYVLQVGVPYGVLVVMGAALCFLVAHVRRQRRTHVIQFGMLAGVLAAASYLALDLPVSRGTQEITRIVITTVMYWVLCVVGYRMSEFRLRGFLPAWHALGALTLLAVLAAGAAGMADDRLWLWTWPHVLARLVVIGLLLWRAWRLRSPKYAALALSALIWWVTIVQSYLILMDWLHWDSFRWSIAGAVPFCVVLLFVFAERFILDREEAAVAQQAAIATERERILQDMHDGMGSNLVAALHIARRPDADRVELVRSLEDTLQDLRLIIDSLDAQDADLQPLLANLRFRLEPRLRAMGVRLEWDVQPLPKLPGMGPDAALSVLRVIQEAVNNAVRHAAPRTIRIAAQLEQAAVTLSVSDDGSGLHGDGGPDGVAIPGGAHGMRGMRARAEKLGGALVVESGAAGTSVRLRLPMEGAPT